MKILGILLVFGLMACGETMNSGTDDESSRLQTTAENSQISSEQTADSMRASLVEEKINVFVACFVTEDETAMVCQPQQDSASNLEFRFDFKAFDFEGQEMKSEVSYDKNGHAHVKVIDISELSHLEVTTKNQGIVIENSPIEFF
ncbi:MAG: hypothetical protein AB8G05_25865 [Oligoflexales bacterium]